MNRLPLKALIELCRSLRHYLGAGLTILDVFKQQATRGQAAVRPVAARIAELVERGESLPDALNAVEGAFPPLFLALAGVGDQTGMMPEVFHELEKHFERQLSLQREFRGRITWPVVQLVLAALILTFLTWFMGQIPGPDGKPIDILGIGLTGTAGAAAFLGAIVGLALLAWLAFSLASRIYGGRAGTSRWLLQLPVLGPCLEALALSRFCLALQLTTESGMSIGKALRLSFRATGNPAFLDAIPAASATIRGGDEVSRALDKAGLFPIEFLRTVEVAEESGTLSEVMKRQGDFYHEEASRRLATITAVSGHAIWAAIALFIIFAIFRLYSFYLGHLSIQLP